MTFAIGLVGILLTAACSVIWKSQPQPEEAGSEAAVAESPSTGTPATAPAEPEASPGKEASRVTTPEPAAAVEEQEKSAPKAVPDRRIAIPPQPVVKPEAPSPAPEELSPLPESVEPPATEAGPVAIPPPKAEPAEEQAAPPLDLDLLEKRLRETKAIGVFTKLALKNQVDDLLDSFRAYYQGHSSTSLTQLRQPYEMLMMKVLALLQDSDPLLANDILSSREAIWKILSDKEKFESY